MKVKLNPAFEQMSGALGDLVFREVNGKTVVSRKPATSGIITEAQAAHRERFRLAAAYGKFAMANQTTRAIYDTASEQKDIPAYALSVADFLNMPSVESIDTSTYHGQVSNTIQIVTSDDFGVVNVHVKLTDPQGATIESGIAVEAPVGTGHWSYTATAAVPAGTIVGIQVIATDRPGGTAVHNITKNL